MEFANEESECYKHDQVAIDKSLLPIVLPRKYQQHEIYLNFSDTPINDTNFPGSRHSYDSIVEQQLVLSIFR